MDTVERVTQEGLSPTPAMRDLARREVQGRFIGFAFFLALGLIGFPLILAAIWDDLSVVGFGGVVVAVGVVGVWGLLAYLFGASAAAGRSLTRDGTYTRYVGPFTVQYGTSRNGPRHVSLEFDGARASLGSEARLPSGEIAALEGLGGGIVDWFPGIGVLTVWDDRGRCVYRARHYGADPDLPPPPTARRPV